MISEEKLLSKFRGCVSCPFLMDSSPPCSECQFDQSHRLSIKRKDIPLDVESSSEDPWFIPVK